MGIMNLAEIMDRSVDILKKYIKSIILFNLIYGIIAFIAVFVLILIGALLGGVTMMATPNLPVLIGGIFIMGIVIAAIVTSMNIGTIKISSQEFLPQEVYASEALGASFKGLFKVIGIIFLGVLIFIPVIAVFGAVFYFLFEAIDNSLIGMEVYNATEIFLIIVFLIALIAAILVIVAYITILSFSLHALVIEKKGVIGSLKKSYWLVKGSFWRLFGITILMSLVIYAINYSLQSIGAVLGGIIYLILKLINTEQDFIGFISSAYSIASWPMSILSWIIISPLGTIMITLLYFNQRFKKEGFDILLKLNEIEKDEERKHLSENTKYNDSL